MSSSRKKAEETVRVVVREFYARYRKDEAWTKRYNSGDDRCLEDLVALACRETSMSVDEYADTFDAHPDLQQLQTRLMTDALLRPLQPGLDNPRYGESAGARVQPKAPWWRFW